MDTNGLKIILSSHEILPFHSGWLSVIFVTRGAILIIGLTTHAWKIYKKSHRHLYLNALTVDFFGWLVVYMFVWLVGLLDFLLLYISYKKIIQFFYVFVHACNFLSLFPVLFLLHNNPKITQKYGGGGSVLMSPDFPGSSWLLIYV